MYKLMDIETGSDKLL